jgi:glucose/arabinose dehydrogenase
MLRRDSSLIWLVAAFAAGSIAATNMTDAMAQSSPLTGSAAFGDWRADKPGTSRLIKPEDLQKPGVTPSVSNGSHVVARPSSAVPQVPDGFKIALFAEGLSGPREMRVAPNGDIFIAETGPGRIRVLPPMAKQNPRPTRFTPADSTARSASRFTRAATIQNGSMSPTMTASSAFPTTPATSKHPRNPKPSSPNCHAAAAIPPGASPSASTASG